MTQERLRRSPKPSRESEMRRKFGFTLVELLVVIAIISILAAIVVPNVADYIRRARMTRAVSEINNAELAITKMLTDVDRKTITQFFANADVKFPTPTDRSGVNDQEELYTKAIYILLRQGRNGVVVSDPPNPVLHVGDPASDAPSYTGLTLEKDVYDKLGTSYMDIGKDPFGNQYRFFAGPLPSRSTLPVTFRCFRAGTEDPNTGDYDPYVYNEKKASEDLKLPGNPPLDPPMADFPDGVPGFPAPRTQSIYIYSPGEDLKPNQLHSDPSEPEKRGGGDDINNWDNERGWSSFYS